ncbi:MAG TPA: glycosyltransferase family 1 protein [Chryseosolibacter sp.]|nr:glycosyltransferase family 1 protein [Chryseosolibacter sp.]
MSLKIGIEAQRLFRPKKHGMDIVALELIKALHAYDAENEYHIFVKNDADSRCLELSNPNFHMHILPAAPYPVWEQMYLPYYASRLKLDILHCTGNTAPLVYFGKKVVTLHDIIFLESNPLNKGTVYQRFGNLYRRLLVPLMVRNTDLLITVSNFEQATIKKHFGSADDNVRVVYNGVGKHFFKKSTTTEIEHAREKYSLPKKFILFLGNENPKKNLLNVVRAYSMYLDEIPDGLDLVVLDFPPGALRQFVEREHLNRLVIKKTYSPGYISNAELPSVIQACEIFLYPSLRESFGIPILEAMACSVPVITSKTSSMPEVAGDAALMVDPLSPVEIKESIIKLVLDKQLRETLVEKGIKRSADFSWEAAAKRSLQIYSLFKK